MEMTAYEAFASGSLQIANMPFILLGGKVVKLTSKCFINRSTGDDYILVFDNEDNYFFMCSSVDNDCDGTLYLINYFESLDISSLERDDIDFENLFHILKNLSIFSY